MIVNIRNLGLQEYLPVWKAMQDFTANRTPSTLDEIWFLEHYPVFTQGQNGKSEHILQSTNIPVIEIDRGGQITYHGPGQCVVYTLIDLKRKKLNIRNLVTALEDSIIHVLNEYDIAAYSKKEAPGIYINEKKICSIGLRVKRGCAYHGLAFNIHMDLGPFQYINPCGFKSLKMTQLTECKTDFATSEKIAEVKLKLLESLKKNLGYTTHIFKTG